MFRRRGQSGAQERMSGAGALVSSQAESGVNPEITDTAVQVITLQKFARLPMSQQQRGVISSSTEKNKQLNQGGGWKSRYVSEGNLSFVLLAALSVFLSAIFRCLSCQVREAGSFIRRGSERLGYASQIHELVLNHLGSCFSQGYFSCIAVSLCLIITGSSRTSWCKRLVRDPIRLKYRLLQLGLTILYSFLKTG